MEEGNAAEAASKRDNNDNEDGYHEEDYFIIMEKAHCTLLDYINLRK